MSGHGNRTTTGRGRWLRVPAGMLVTLVIGAGGVAATSVPAVGASTRTAAAIATAPFTAPTGVALDEAPPPWGLPADARPYIAAAGLQVLGQEQLEVHYHAHVDVIVDGDHVTVPAGIGFVIDQGRATGITTLHTHDASGIIHIESASNDAYTLGQVFTEWGVALGAAQLGGLPVDATHVLQTYVDGHRFRGDPATIRLRPHLEIALWYGPSGTRPNVAKSYHFPRGL